MLRQTHLLDLIGNTPLVETHALDTGLCRLLLKLENQNPGGSIKDDEVIAAANEHGMAMIFTGMRHFRH